MKSKNAKIKAIVMAAVMSFTSLTPALAADKTWAYEKDTISSDSYTVMVVGNTMELTASTAYANGYVGLSASITGKYVGSGFTGTRTVSKTASKLGCASASILLSGSNRFTCFSSTHKINKLYRYFKNVAVY